MWVRVKQRKGSCGSGLWKAPFSTTRALRCGLLALVDPRLSVPMHNFDEGLAELHHRGPDAARKWRSPDKKVTLGHTRLSIIDLAGGSQPIANERGDIVAIVNGELYDFEAIRAQLQAKGHKFSTNSDSEIVVHLYEEHGFELFPHLRGDFAFVIWDQRSETVVFARDRFGIKPLSYAHHPSGALCLASEKKALFKLGVEAKWNERVLVGGMGAASVISPLFKGVHDVPPGHYVVTKAYDPSYLRAVKYWDVDFEEKGSALRVSEGEAKENVRRLLEESIRLRLRADVPVSVYLSGGLDSCATLALSSHILKRDYGKDGIIDAFTISFEEHREYDEAAIAERFAQLHGARFHKIPLKQQDMVNYFEDATFHAESFNSNMNYVAKYALSRELRGYGYKVALSGEGSDEIFLGYPFFKKHLLDDWEPTRKERFLEKLLGDYKLTKSAFALNHVPTAMDKQCQNELGFSTSIFSTFDSDLQIGTKEAFRNVPHFNVLLELSSRFLCPEVIHKMKTSWNPVYNDTYLWLKTMFVALLLGTFGDRMEMANSIEVRTPFLDHKLVEYVTKLPVELKLKIDEEHATMIEKHIFRESVKELLNDELYHRIKHPFYAPPLKLNTNGPMYEYVQDTLRSKAFGDSQPFFDRKWVLSLLDGKGTNQDLIDTVLVSLCQFHILNTKFKPSFDT